MDEDEWRKVYGKRGNLYVISGPSGVGKTTIIDRLRSQDPDLLYSISHTTRQKREGEVDGEDYYFVSKNEFETIRESGGFLEWAEVFGEYYGTSREVVEDALESNKDVLMDIDVQGASQIRQEKLSGSIFIFLAPPSRTALKRRILNRGSEDSAEREARMRVIEEEMGHIGEFDYLVVNDELGRALDDFRSIIHSERLRVSDEFSGSQPPIG